MDLTTGVKVDNLDNNGVKERQDRESTVQRSKQRAEKEWGMNSLPGTVLAPPSPLDFGPNSHWTRYSVESNPSPTAKRESETAVTLQSCGSPPLASGRDCSIDVIRPGVCGLGAAQNYLIERRAHPTGNQRQFGRPHGGARALVCVHNSKRAAFNS